MVKFNRGLDEQRFIISYDVTDPTNTEQKAMKTTKDYLEEVKKRHGLSSDYALAKLLGITPQAMTKKRKGGGLDDYTALKVAQALDINPLEIIAAGNQERAKSAEEKAAWERILKSVAACTVAVFLLLLPTEKQESSTSGINQTNNSTEYILCELQTLSINFRSRKGLFTSIMQE